MYKTKKIREKKPEECNALQKTTVANPDCWQNPGKLSAIIKRERKTFHAINKRKELLSTKLSPREY